MLPPRPNITPMLLQDYYTRVQLSLVLALLILIGIARWWPLPSESPPEDIVYRSSAQEIITIEEIQPTRQQNKPPPPPPPPIPIVVPDDVVIEDQIYVDDAQLAIETSVDAQELAAALPAGEASAAKAPEIGAKPLRFVEAEYPRAALRRKVRAEVVIEVLVDARGQVKEARIVERFLYAKEKEEKEVVAELAYGLEESALKAAQRWMFQPARKDGQPVQSYYTMTLGFGV